jgi:hypothetical protein
MLALEVCGHLPGGDKTGVLARIVQSAVTRCQTVNLTSPPTRTMLFFYHSAVPFNYYSFQDVLVISHIHAARVTFPCSSTSVALANAGVAS